MTTNELVQLLSCLRPTQGDKKVYVNLKRNPYVDQTREADLEGYCEIIEVTVDVADDCVCITGEAF